MRKKIFIAVFIVLVWMVTSTVAYANSSTDSTIVQNELPVEFQGKIHSSIRMVNENTGEIQILHPKLVGSHFSENGTSFLTYEFGIPGEAIKTSNNISNAISHLFPKTVQASSKNYSGCDSTVSGCASLTFNFTASSNHMYANSVSVTWTKSDPLVTFTSGSFGAACYANWYNKSGICNTSSTKSITSPSSGTAYSMTPSFAGSSNTTYYDDLDGQKAFQSLKMKRGSTTWTFSFCVAVGGGSIIYGCY